MMFLTLSVSSKRKLVTVRLYLLSCSVYPCLTSYKCLRHSSIHTAKISSVGFPELTSWHIQRAPAKIFGLVFPQLR